MELLTVGAVAILVAISVLSHMRLSGEIQKTNKEISSLRGLSTYSRKREQKANKMLESMGKKMERILKRI